MNKSSIASALVLGGEGQIGKPLVDFLNRRNIKTYNIDLVLGEEHDLRKNCALLEKWLPRVDVVFFLAYDIGGAKFLQTKQDDYQFLENNTKIMVTVFEALRKHNKPFLFASSVMARMPWSPYGNLKQLGEHFTKSLGGVTARFWNIYGPEHDEEKSHVITDFIKKAKDTGVIQMMTDGSEVRQFLYAEDCSEAMLALLSNYDEAVKYNTFDITSFIWTDIRSIAELIANHYGAKIIKPNNKDTVQLNSRIEPSRHPIEKFWNPDSAIHIELGIRKMIEYYEGNHEKR